MGAKATAIFDADDSKLQRAFKSIDHSLKKTQEAFATTGEFAAKLFAAPAAAALALGLGIRDALEQGAHFANLSAQTGVAVKDLVVLSQEFRNAGQSGEEVGKVVGKMQRAITEGTANEVIAQMGLEMDALRKQTPIEQFHALGKAINGLQNPAERTAAAMTIFGKAGAELLPVFASGGFGNAAAQVGAQADLLATDAALFHEVADHLNLAGQKVSGFFVGVADKVAPVLKPLLDDFADMDFSQLGQEVGDVLANIATAFGDGKIGELLLDSLKIAGAGLVNFLAGAFLAQPAMLGAGLMKAGAMFINLMLEGVAKILDGLSHIPGMKSAGILGARGVRSAESTFDKVAALDMGKVISSAMSAGKIFDTDKMNEHHGELIDGIVASTRAQQAKALAEVPTTTPGDPGDGIFEKDKAPNVSALTRIGGGFGGSMGDPLLQEGQRQTSLLARIAKAVEGNVTAGEPMALIAAGYG